MRKHRSSAAPQRQHTQLTNRGEAVPPADPPPLVTVRCGGNTVVGYAECLSESDVLVQALEEIPPLDGECEVVLDFPAGSITARGNVVQVDASGRLFRVSLDKVESGGPLLLTAVLLTSQQSAGVSGAGTPSASPPPRNKKQP